MGRMLGPIVALPQCLVHCNPVGLVPKGRNVGRWRMIVDLSSPRERSVNDGIQKHFCPLKCASVDDAIQFILAIGPNTLLLKIYLKSAYQMVPVHPQDQVLLGIRWECQTFVDQALPFSLQSAPIPFTTVSGVIGWALMQAGAPPLIHYLDNFHSTFHGTALKSQIIGIPNHLGVLVAVHIIEDPATTITLLGILIDTHQCELRLPLKKLEFTCNFVSVWRQRCLEKVPDFESFLCHHSHAATVIRQGHTFLRHAFEILALRSP